MQIRARTMPKGVVRSLHAGGEGQGDALLSGQGNRPEGSRGLCCGRARNPSEPLSDSRSLCPLRGDPVRVFCSEDDHNSQGLAGRGPQSQRGENKRAPCGAFIADERDTKGSSKSSNWTCTFCGRNLPGIDLSLSRRGPRSRLCFRLSLGESPLIRR